MFSVWRSRVLMAWLFCFFLVVSAWADEWQIGVQTVFDGDTVLLTNEDRLRLRGIDAPEVRHGKKRGQYYGQEAKALVQQLVQGQKLVLDSKELSRDRYDRLIGTPRLENGRNVALVLVQEGAAFVYPHTSDKDMDFAQDLLAAQVTAMNRGLGFWPKILSLPVAQHTYLGTISSKRFHTTTCASGLKVKKQNQVRFLTLREAFAKGYAPARCCTPWPKD